MSITNVKDLDILLLTYLNNIDLLSLALTNKYYWNIYNNRILWYLKIKEFCIPDKYLKKTKDKKYYIDIYKSIKNKDFVTEVFNAIENNRSDKLFLNFVKRDLNPNYNFIINYDERFHKNLKNTYYSEKRNCNLINCFSPIKLVINSGDDLMWEIINSLKYKLKLDSGIYINCITNTNMKIFRDILKYEIPVTCDMLLFSIRCYNVEITEIFLNIVNNKTVDDVMNIILINHYKEYKEWSLSNEAFRIFYKFYSNSNLINRHELKIII